MTEPDRNTTDMREEYDFSKGVRGKHYQSYRAGHVVRVQKSGGRVEERHFSLADGAVIVDPPENCRHPSFPARVER